MIQFTEKIAKIRITAEGKTALNKNAEQLTQLQLKVLLACQKKALAPSGTRIRSAQERQAIIEKLALLGLITLESKIHEVWLTPAGRQYLAEEYTPTGGGNINLTGLKQKLCPNKATTSFISCKYVLILVEPFYKTERHSCTKSL